MVIKCIIYDEVSFSIMAYAPIVIMGKLELKSMSLDIESYIPIPYIRWPNEEKILIGEWINNHFSITNRSNIR